MTKPVGRKLAVDSVLYWFSISGVPIAGDPNLGLELLCPECKSAILPGQEIDFDHRAADVHGGEHSFLNVRPVHRHCHRKIKTPRDIKANAKVKRLAKERAGQPKRKRRSRKLKSGRKMAKRHDPWGKERKK